MYTKSSYLYDLIYAKSGKNYLQEAEILKDIILNFNQDYRTILNVACGTAEHDKYLKQYFQVDGLDINETFIDLAKSKNPECNYYIGDMRDYSLDKKYDVITCLFSSIGFMQSLTELETTIRTFKNHLDKGGMIIIEPFFEPSGWRPEKFPLHMKTYEDRAVKYARLAKSSTEGRYSIIQEFHSILTTDGYEHFEENFKQYLFERGEIETIIRNNGFTYVYDEEGLIGRGLHIGILSK